MFNSFPKKPGPYVPKGGAEGQVLSKNSSNDFDTIWTEGGAGGAGDTGPGYYATSTTSLLIEVASKTFTTQNDLAYSVGARVRASSAADTANYMEGLVTSYSGTTLIISIDRISGSGTYADWNINLAGDTGVDGAPGAAAGVGGAITIAYTFSTTTGDADPGNGKLRLSSATQNTSTTIRADLVSSDTTDWTAVLDTIDGSTSTIKGHIRLFKASDPTKWLLFQVTALASPSGYKNISVTNIGSSSSSPFVNNDAIFLSFERTGDSFQHRVVNAASSATPTINVDVTDFYSIGSLATNITGVTVTGTPVDRQPLWVCIKGTATRTITWGSSFAVTTVALPAATVGTAELKVGFIYSATRAVWECVAVA